MDLEIAHSTDAFAKEEWDALAGINALCSYGWVRCMERTWLPVPRPVYFLLRKNSRLVGGALCYESTSQQRYFDSDDTLLGPLRATASRIGVSAFPALVCSPLQAYGDHFFVAHGVAPADRRRTEGELLTAMEQYASDKSYSLIFQNLLDHEHELLALLGERGYLRTILTVVNYLDIRWSSFDEYLKHLKSISEKISRNIRHQMRRADAEGVSIRVLDDIHRNQERLYELASNHYQKLNSCSVSFTPEFFGELSRQLGQDMVAYGAWKSGELVGFCLMLRKGGIAHCKIIGIDHDRIGRDLTYFNLAYHYPVMDAIAANMKRIYYGSALNRVKRRRGCDASPAYLCYRPQGVVKKALFRPLMYVHARRAMKKVPPWAIAHRPAG